MCPYREHNGSTGIELHSTSHAANRTRPHNDLIKNLWFTFTSISFQFYVHLHRHVHNIIQVQVHVHVHVDDIHILVQGCTSTHHVHVHANACKVLVWKDEAVGKGDRFCKLTDIMLMNSFMILISLSTNSFMKSMYSSFTPNLPGGVREEGRKGERERERERDFKSLSEGGGGNTSQHSCTHALMHYSSP